MDIDDQVGLENLLFFDRRCRVCGEVKGLLTDFYLTRKNRNKKQTDAIIQNFLKRGAQK